MQNQTDKANEIRLNSKLNVTITKLKLLPTTSYISSDCKLVANLYSVTKYILVRVKDRIKLSNMKRASLPFVCKQQQSIYEGCDDADCLPTACLYILLRMVKLIELISSTSKVNVKNIALASNVTTTINDSVFGVIKLRPQLTAKHPFNTVRVMVR